MAFNSISDDEIEKAAALLAKNPPFRVIRERLYKDGREVFALRPGKRSDYEHLRQPYVDALMPGQKPRNR